MVLATGPERHEPSDKSAAWLVFMCSSPGFSGKSTRAIIKIGTGGRDTEKAADLKFRLEEQKEYKLVQ